MNNTIPDNSWQHRFNKEFELKAWLELEPPPHMTESQWIFAVYELHTMLAETETGRNNRSMVILGWKSQHGLI